MSRWKNDNDVRLTFDHRGKEVSVASGEEFVCEDHFDYSIAACGVRLTKAEVRSPTVAEPKLIAADKPPKKP